MVTPQISLIIAVKCLLTRQAVESINSTVTEAADKNAEVFVVAGVPLETLPLKRSPALTIVQASKNALVPEMWGQGIIRASGSTIALLDPYFVINDGWFEAVDKLKNLPSNIAGIGGPIRPKGTADLKDWACFFCRYSRFLSARSDVEDIAGDNACYRRENLLKYSFVNHNGFWETIFHNQLKEEGLTIKLCSEMAVHQLPGVDPIKFFLERIRHGFHFGSTREDVYGFSRSIRIATSPLIVPFLVSRIARRVARHDRGMLAKLVLSLPWLTFFLIGWTIGESFGYCKRLEYS